MSPFGIPEYIPHTPIKIYGLLVIGTILTVLIFAQKELLRKNATLGIIELTLLGTAICFIREFIFQIILSFTETSDKLYHFIVALTSITIICAFLSFFVAFQLKTRHTKRLLLFIVLSLILFKLLMITFPKTFHS